MARSKPSNTAPQPRRDGPTPPRAFHRSSIRRRPPEMLAENLSGVFLTIK
jgi:hypothetical protein